MTTDTRPPGWSEEDWMLVSDAADAMARAGYPEGSRDIMTALAPLWERWAEHIWDSRMVHLGVFPFSDPRYPAVTGKAVVYRGFSKETFLLIPPGSDWYPTHGRRVNGMEDTFYAEPGLLEAALIARECQNTVCKYMLWFEGRFERLLRALYRQVNLGVGLGEYDVRAQYRDFGLTVHRFDMFRGLAVALNLLTGRLSPPNAECRLLVPQSSKPEWMTVREGETPLLDTFPSVDFECRMTRKEVGDFEAAFSDLKGTGVLPELSGVDLRFRRMRDLRHGGLYYSDLRMILLDPRSRGTFVHEYGHALDFAGGLSGSERFAPLYERYRELVMPTEFYRRSSRKEYYMRRTEAFARMFERYVYLRIDTGPLNRASEDAVHPADPKLDVMVLEYYGDL